MQPIPVNYVAVLVGAVFSMFLGFLWYGPLFGKTWAQLQGWTEESMAAAKARGGMGKKYALMFVGSLVMSFVLAHALIFASVYLQASGVSAGLTAGFWNWLGFIAPVTLSSVLWEGKPWKLWLINNAYYLVYLMAAGVLLAVWK